MMIWIFLYLLSQPVMLFWAMGIGMGISNLKFREAPLRHSWVILLFVYSIPLILISRIVLKIIDKKNKIGVK